MLSQVGDLVPQFLPIVHSAYNMYTHFTLYWGTNPLQSAGVQQGLLGSSSILSHHASTYRTADLQMCSARELGL